MQTDFIPQLSYDGSTLAAAALLAMIGFAAMTLYVMRLRDNLARADVSSAATRDLVHHLSEGIYRSLPNGRQLSANPALVRLNGYDSEAEMLPCVNDIAAEWYVEPGRRAEFLELLERDGTVEDFVSEIYRHKTRERIWVSEAARLVRDPSSGATLYFEGSVREITETVRRLKLEEQFQKLTAHLPGGLFQTVHRDGVDRIVYLSDGFCRISGIPDEEHRADSTRFIKLIHRDDLPAFLRTYRISGESMTPWDHEFRIVDPAGVEKWLRVVATPEAVDGALNWHGHLADISVRKLQEMEIGRLAYTDPLTQLPNRRRLYDLLEASLRRREAGGLFGALVFIDLDNFKSVNDTLGHAVGDRYLIDVAGRLKACLRPQDVVARIGGDEFVVILDRAGSGRAGTGVLAIATANRILEALRAPYQFGDTPYASSASLGVVVYDGVDTTADEVLRQADQAMYRAKNTGRDGLALFDGEACEITQPAATQRRQA